MGFVLVHIYNNPHLKNAWIIFVDMYTITFTINATVSYSTLQRAVLNGGSVEDGLVFILDHPD